MINLKNFDDKTALEIFNEARQKIELINSEWTYTQLSDPGITILELLSWLKRSQHEYLNKISGRTKVKLLKLLGINLKKRCGSKAFIRIKNSRSDLTIPKNTKWKSGTLVFENEKLQFITKSDILSVNFNNPEFKKEKKYYDFDGTEKILIFGNDNLKDGESREFVINLSNALPKNKPINLYFSLLNDNERNKINNNSFVPLANVEWKYFGEKNGKKGWFNFDFVDYTYAFLFSGIVSLKYNYNMIPLNGLFRIKCKLLKSDYDFMPQVSKIDLNVFEVVQKDTKCYNSVIEKSDVEFDDNFIKFNVCNHLCLYGQSLLYVGFDDSWIGIKKFEILKNLEDGYCSFRINKSELKSTDLNNVKFIVVSFSNDLKNKTIIGSGKGYSNLFFETDFKDLSVYDDFQIMVGEKINDSLKFKIWQRVDDFFGSSKFDNHFVYEENLKIIAFGDNHHGVIPRKYENNIRFCKLSFTQGEDSNLRENMINEVETENEILKNASVVQITPAIGGINDESFDDAQRKVSKIFEDDPRAVLASDYVEIVKKTPGLIIKDVAVSIGKDKLENKVLIAVRIPGKKDIPALYKKNILNWIENFRLINTKIEILSPVTVFLDIRIKAILRPDYVYKTNVFEEEINQFIENLNNKMGQNLVYGDLLKKLQGLECVYYLDDLEISSSIQSSNDKYFYDDIIVPMNAIYELRKLDINSRISTEI